MGSAHSPATGGELIFVSYATRDGSQAAGDLVDRARGAGMECWLDRDRLDLARPIAPQLAGAVRRACCLLLIESVASRESRWVQFELRLAGHWRVPVIRLYAGRPPDWVPLYNRAGACPGATQ